MKIEKFVVLFCFLKSTRSFQVRYCGICSNHTLCQYPVDGPGSQCVSYEKTSWLTNKDTLEIVKRINERRHLVATGLLHRFPQAANMKKMIWSVKLASFAQRWADQCDPLLKPSRKDECRDLVSMKVGQNIATVLGPSPGLSVKSLVDIWFMLNLNFEGSVAYYNESKDSKTDYFTQLIWADTAFVGCGRAKFFVAEINTFIERLVCNFAPKGNIQGKPIYTIGYPGTQCPEKTIPDATFPGLCLQTTGRVSKFIHEVSSADSLLRVLNLSNNSLKRELDPNNLKQILNNSETNGQRNQKTRHVYLNKSYGAVKRDSAHHQNPMSNSENYNNPQYLQRQFTQERGHSRMYHGYQSSKEPMYTMDTGHVPTESDIRRTYYTTPAPFSTNSIQDARKLKVDSECTRKMISEENHNFLSPNPPFKSKTNDCPRGDSHNCLQSYPCQHTTFARLEKPCPCNEPPPIQCDCSRQCPPTNCPSFTTTYCPYQRVGGDEPNKFNQFDSYDLFHNLQIKSVEENSAPNQRRRYENPYPVNIDKIENSRRELHPDSQVKAIRDEPLLETRKKIYRSFDYSKRKKRELEEKTFKPFWQMDEYNQKKPSELKSIRYTTLANKRYRKTRKTTPTARLQTSTETITIKPKDKSSVQYSHRGRVTEKYLSFDELMHLRKLSTAVPIDEDARRKADDNNDLRQGSSTESTVITANTPFIRQKHCTRKLTCTWTAAIGGADGGGSGGVGIDIGSRTPPGYVDGCTRTSTCTRDHMDRNKMATSSESPGGTTPEEDEDYCERRSLNVRRRNLDDNAAATLSIGYQEAKTDLPVLSTQIGKIIKAVENEHTEINSQNDKFSCICNEDATRVKRGEIKCFGDILAKNFNSLKANKSAKSKCVLYRDGMMMDSHSRHLNSKSKITINSYQRPCNGTKSLQKMFYGAITLKYCFSWMFYCMFIRRRFEG